MVCAIRLAKILSPKSVRSPMHENTRRIFFRIFILFPLLLRLEISNLFVLSGFCELIIFGEIFVFYTPTIRLARLAAPLENVSVFIHNAAT